MQSSFRRRAMPIHDWTRVTAGVFHHFHQRWIGAISDALNAGRLPVGYYALAEQVAGNLGPDVLALEFDAPDGDESAPGSVATAVSQAPPKASFTASAEMDH